MGTWNCEGLLLSDFNKFSRYLFLLSQTRHTCCRCFSSRNYDQRDRSCQLDLHSYWRTAAYVSSESRSDQAANCASDSVFWNTTGLSSNFTTQHRVFERVNIEKENGTEYNVTVIEVVEVLLINRSHRADNYYILCIAENSVGKGFDTANLQVNCKTSCHALWRVRICDRQ